jgi:hypothetical protein
MVPARRTYVFAKRAHTPNDGASITFVVSPFVGVVQRPSLFFEASIVHFGTIL